MTHARLILFGFAVACLVLPSIKAPAQQGAAPTTAGPTGVGAQHTGTEANALVGPSRFQWTLEIRLCPDQGTSGTAVYADRHTHPA
jgi:hypothetical protein